MQGFLFVSGYFSKNTEKCRKNAVKSFLFPYFLLTTLLYSVEFLIDGKASFDYITPRFGLWFLIAMFVYRFAMKDLSRIPHILVISLALYFLSGCIPALGRDFALGRIFSFLFFFTAGYFFQWEYIKKIHDIPKKYAFLVMGLLILASYVIAANNLIPVEMWHLKDAYSVYGLSNIEGMLMRLVMMLMTMGWLFVIINLTPDKKICFSGIGSVTITIFVCHLPIRNMIKAAHIPVGNEYVAYGICIALAVLVIYVFSRPIIFNGYNKFVNTIYDLTVSPAYKTYRSLTVNHSVEA